MSEPQAPYRAGSAPDASLDSVAAAVARFNAEDPHLVELLDRARRAGWRGDCAGVSGWGGGEGD